VVGADGEIDKVNVEIETDPGDKDGDEELEKYGRDGELEEVVDEGAADEDDELEEVVGEGAADEDDVSKAKPQRAGFPSAASSLKIPLSELKYPSFDVSVIPYSQ
jgi:hypothetical protein